MMNRKNVLGAAALILLSTLNAQAKYMLPEVRNATDVRVYCTNDGDVQAAEMLKQSLGIAQSDPQPGYDIRYDSGMMPCYIKFVEGGDANAAKLVALRGRTSSRESVLNSTYAADNFNFTYSQRVFSYKRGSRSIYYTYHVYVDPKGNAKIRNLLDAIRTSSYTYGGASYNSVPATATTIQSLAQ